MPILRNRHFAALIVASALMGCVTVHAPLERDTFYPSSWGKPIPLGRECKTLEGRYRNEGDVTIRRGETAPLRLTDALHLHCTASTVTLSPQTQKLDRHGDAFVTLQIITDDDPQSANERTGCFCIKETLVCTQVKEEYWSFPNLGLGGSQRNIYFSRTEDGALIARLQDYHADIVLGIPLFGMEEPWARFMEAPATTEDQ